MAASATGRPASVMQRPDLPVAVALGNVDPALVAGFLDGHCRFAAAPDDADLAVASGREPQAVADPAWRTHRAAHPGGDPAGHPRTKEFHA